MTTYTLIVHAEVKRFTPTLLCLKINNVSIYFTSFRHEGNQFELQYNNEEIFHVATTSWEDHAVETFLKKFTDVM